MNQVDVQIQAVQTEEDLTDVRRCSSGGCLDAG